MGNAPPALPQNNNNNNNNNNNRNGNATQTITSSHSPPPVASSPWYNKNVNYPRERLRYGIVNAKITSLAYTNRRQSEQESSFIITPRGCIFHGSQANPGNIQSG